LVKPLEEINEILWSKPIAEGKWSVSEILEIKIGVFAEGDKLVESLLRN